MQMLRELTESSTVRMLRNTVKTLFLSGLSLEMQRRLAEAFIRNIVVRSSNENARSLDDLFASMDWLQTLLEDRIRQIKFSGRVVPDPPTQGSREPFRTWLMEEHAPWRGLSVDPIEMPGMISDEETQYYEFIGRVYEGRGELD
jgi:hypothetical protein